MMEPYNDFLNCVDLQLLVEERFPHILNMHHDYIILEALINTIVK